MKLLKKSLLLFLVAAVLMSIQTQTLTALAETLSQPKVTVIQNDYIKVTVDNATGRYGIRTVEGQPIRKNDQNVNMLFRGDDPETSFTTFKINGTDYIFGNPYKFGANLFSETTQPKVVANRDGTQHIETVWTIEGVSIKQILMLYNDSADLKNAGNVNIRYEVYNGSNASVEIGSRMLLDTMVAGNDGPQFQIGTAYRSPLTVERKLVHEPDVPLEDRAYYKLPPYWVMRDTLDLTNPLATNAIAYGFNNIAENHINIVDEMIVGHWNGLANTKWDYEVNPNLDFTRDTNQYGTADAAVALYWLPEQLAKGKSTSFETVYGIGEVVQPDKVFSIRYLDPVQQLATLPDLSGYKDEGVFDIIAEIENLPAFNMEHSEIRLNMTLQSGLAFVKLDEQGQIVRDPKTKKIVTEKFNSKEFIYKKPATPAELEQGILPKYKPGDAITTTFKVIATGRPWPTTKQYLLTASSPETKAKLTASTQEDAGLLAEYESSQANFVLLPAIGEAAATYVYALSPAELYSSDVKYITANLTNIEAYNTGSDTSEPNFDLYLRNVVNGDRYKVNVKDSVLLQPTDDGASGDMRITYRGGDKVDSAGIVIEADLGPELPLGEYQLEIDYKGNAGGDEELATLFDITTDQTFLVTDNDVARMREANTIVIYKQTVDISNVPLSANEEQLEDINEVFYHKPFQPGGSLAAAKTELTQARTVFAMKSRAVDPDLEVDELLDTESYEELPVYNFELFSSDEELEEFFDNRDDRTELVTIRGMIKQVGTKDDLVTVVDTSTEPAIINEAVAYKGKDMSFTRGNLEVFGNKYSSPLLDTLFVKGDGVLSVASSGFVFHRGEWTLDFFNGFNKDLEAAEDEDEDEDEEENEDEDENEENDNPEDDSLNGALKWAYGAIGSRLNPIRQLMISDVYFNKQSLFNSVPLSIGGFGFQFYDATLRPGGISFGGMISFKVVEGEIKNVVFNDRGFVGVDAALRFKLDSDLGMLKGNNGASGELSVTHYEQKVEGINNYYGLKFEADLDKIAKVGVELAFKKVDDGRILPDVIGFSTDLPSPGILVTGATYLTAVRGALRELADTIAGGTANDPFPLTLEAGVSLRFGIAPAYHFGDIDMTLKRTGIKFEGKLSFSTEEDPDDDDLVPMITRALLEAQWVTPWFVRLEAEVDIMGWDVIVGKAGIFVGQNLEKNRTDFEGFLGAKVQIPSSVPIVGGLPLSSVFFGVNNDKIWGSVAVLLISLGVTYYWGGGIEFGTSDEDLPDGLIHMLVDSPEKGQQLVVIGQGVETLATSWISPETETLAVQYHNVAEGVQVVDNGTNLGVGGIVTSNGGRTHDISMNAVSGSALIEVDYDGPQVPKLMLTDSNGNSYPIEFDNSNTSATANAFTQHIPAANSLDGTDSYKAYIMIAADQLKAGVWTLNSSAKVETKLMNIPTPPQLRAVNLESDASNENAFQANWMVENARENDLISLYLAETAVDEYATTDMGGEAVLQPSDPGLLLAKDIPVSLNGGTDGNMTSGSFDIDVTQVSLLGGTEDIRGLLRQGNYFLRAELKSDIGYETMTSPERFMLIDPLAPESVNDVKIEPAGNGLFALSFRPGVKKQAHEQFEHSYVIEALVTGADSASLERYDQFAEVMYTAEELAPYWNPSTGQYEGIPVGGMYAVDGIDDSGQEIVKYVGLETDKLYTIGVSAVTKPTKDEDEHESYHFAERKNSNLEWLPTPSYPKLRSVNQEEFTSSIEYLTNENQPSIAIAADQTNIEVEAIFNGESIGKAALNNDGDVSKGTLTLNNLPEDGTYAVELVARNRVTKDQKTTLLYLTVDTTAPILYLESPITGARTTDGFITVKGQTSNDANLTVNGTAIAIDRQGNGSFEASIPVVSSDPTVTLEILARDDAGNENTAQVQITNDSYRAPIALEFREMKLERGETRKLEAFLRVPDRKDSDGKAIYKTVAIPDSDYEELLSFSIAVGTAATVSENGEVAALAVGASLVQAEYEFEGVVLSAQLPVNVVQPKLAGLEALDAYTTKASIRNRTKVIVKDSGDLTGYQLVYKVFTAREEAVKPKFEEDLSQWTLLPADGVVAVSSGDRIIVAKRASLLKTAAAVSSVLIPEVSSGGGAIPMLPLPTEQGMEIYANGNVLATEWIGNTLVAKLTANDLVLTGIGNITLSAKDNAVKNIQLIVEQEAREALAAAGRDIIIDLPSIKMFITAKQLLAVSGNYEINLVPNSSEIKKQAAQLTETFKAALLGGGQGITITSNAGSSNKTISKVQVAIPEQIRAQDIRAIIIMDEKGNWTPLPWSISVSDAQAYAELLLTEEGSIFFVQNSPSFTDVPSSFWAKEVIQAAASNLLVFGKGNNRYDPNNIVTRAEFPTMLLRSAGLMMRAGKSSFADVAEKDWFYSSVSIATSIGIVSGTTDSTYSPSDTLTRVQGITMVGRLLEWFDVGSSITDVEVTNILKQFEDSSTIPDYAKKPIALAVKYGIVKGSNNRINPQAVLTRAQAAVIITQLQQLLIEKGVQR